MIRRPPRSTLDRSSAASDVYKRQVIHHVIESMGGGEIGHGESVAIDVSACAGEVERPGACLLYTYPSPRDLTRSRMPSSA